MWWFWFLKADKVKTFYFFLGKPIDQKVANFIVQWWYIQKRFFLRKHLYTIINTIYKLSRHVVWYQNDCQISGSNPRSSAARPSSKIPPKIVRRRLGYQGEKLRPQFVIERKIVQGWNWHHGRRYHNFWAPIFGSTFNVLQVQGWGGVGIGTPSPKN
jgi:hypothetical protein